MKRLLPAIGTVLTFALLSRPLLAQDFKLVANNSVRVSELSSAQAAKIFLKQASKYPDGAAAAPVYQRKAAAPRVAFDKSVLHRTVAAVETFWQQQIFSGKDVPPPTKAGDEEVVTFVKGTPGGIGYVSSGAPVAGVKVIAIR